MGLIVHHILMEIGSMGPKEAHYLPFKELVFPPTNYFAQAYEFWDFATKDFFTCTYVPFPYPIPDNLRSQPQQLSKFRFIPTPNELDLYFQEH